MTNETNRHLRTHGFGPHELATVFFRHKKKAAFFSLSVVALATLVILYAPRAYRSEARLFMQVGRESVRLDPTATTGKTIALQQSGRDNEIATAIEVLRSRAIIEKAVAKLTPEVVLGQAGVGKVEPNPIADAALAPLKYAVGAIKGIDPISKREEAVIAIGENLEVDAEFDSTVIVLTYDAETPQLAQQVMGAIVEVFRDEYVRLHRTTGSKPFFTQQRAELEKQLAVAEQELRAAKNRMGVASVETRRSTIETRLSSIELSRNSTVQNIAAAEARVDALRSHTDALPETLQTSTRTMPNTGADTLRSQLYALQVQLLNLESKYTPEHPQVAATRAQVAEAQKMVAQEAASREETVDSLNDNRRLLSLDLAQVESQLAGYQAQLTELDAQRAEALKDVKQLNDYEVELDKLDRDVMLARTNFLNYAEALEQARMDEALDNERITNVNVAQAATLAEKPVSPSKLLVGALSLLMATTGALALVLGSEKFDSRLRGEEQVEQVLQLPVFAAVPDGRVYGAIPTS